jgi:hypothetical protein
MTQKQTRKASQVLLRITYEEREALNKAALLNGDTQIGYVRRKLGLLPYPLTSRTQPRKRNGFGRPCQAAP